MLIEKHQCAFPALYQASSCSSIHIWQCSAGEQAALPMLSVALLQDTNVKKLRPAFGLAMGRHNLMVAGLNPDLGALKAQVVVSTSHLPLTVTAVWGRSARIQ